MNRRDKKAIASLIRHKNNLKTPADFDSNWISKLADLLLKYLGSESLLYNTVKNWYSFANKGNVAHMNDCLKALENAVEFIEDNGIKKEHSFWRTLENTNKSVIVTIILFLVNIIFWSGYLVADYKKTKADFNLVVENNKLKDSLTSIKKNINKTESENTTHQPDINDVEK